MTAATKQAIKRSDSARRFGFTRRRVVAVVALLLLAIVATVAAIWWRQSNTTRAMRSITHAFSQRRPIEGRLTGGFKGAPFVPPIEGDTLLQSEEIIDASRLASQALSSNEPGARLVYARLLLLTGDKGTTTLKSFRQAVAAEPGSAAATNDLGVCLLARGELEEALTSFDAALEQQPGLAEALFNRAVCYQQLQLRNAASEDFARLLTTERDAGWREEINRRREDVAAPISSQARQAEVVTAFDRACAGGEVDEGRRIADESLNFAITHVYDDCYQEAVKAAAVDDVEVSRREVFKIKLIGERLAAASGDKSIQELAAHVESLSREAAVDEAGLAREYLEITHLPTFKSMWERRNDLLALATRFKASGNQLFEYYSIYQVGYIAHGVSAFDDALVRINEALRLAQSQSWPYRRAAALMQLSNTYARLGRDSLALNYSRLALGDVHALPYSEAKALQGMATACWHLGDLRQGLQYLLRSSHIFSTKAPSFDNLASNLLQVADCYRLMNNHKLALLCGRQALAYAEAGAIQSYTAQAASFIAVELARQNQFAESEAEMQRAADALEKASSSQRAYAEWLVYLRAGDIASQRGDLQQAETDYARAKTAAENGKDKPLPLIRVLRAQAETYARAGQAEAARVDLEQAIALIEEYRANIIEPNNRSDFFDASQDVFDQMIQLRAHAFSQWAEAFNIAEQARARTLIDEIALMAGQTTTQHETQATKTATPRSASALTLNQVQAALPAGLTLISYSVSSHGTLIFVVRRDGFGYGESAATTESLSGLVQDYLEALAEQAPIAEVVEQSRRLYDALIAPVASQLGAARRICIVPDKALHRLPFVALTDETNHYLIQSHILTSAPSASTLAYCIDRARAKGAVAEERFLAVGNPQFSRDDFPTLKMLPDAEHEANECADLYAHKVVLTRANATKAQLLTELPRCDIAHFSTHCLVEEKTPWLAALLLTETAAGKEDQLLRLNELNKIGLLRARLVILSACQSALGQYYRGEGMVSLVRPFLARGVPTVVASLWPVDSQATATLMIDFHRARTRTHPFTAGALREAQLQMLQSSSFSHPYYWAPFVVIGSGN
ncbi:MAG: CHAT domain-containing protein [Blastocatellia bacterium]